MCGLNSTGQEIGVNYLTRVHKKQKILSNFLVRELTSLWVEMKTCGLKMVEILGSLTY